MDAIVTLKMTAREFDLLRMAVDDTLLGFKRSLEETTDPKSRQDMRAMTVQYSDLRAKLF